MRKAAPQSKTARTAITKGREVQPRVTQTVKKKIAIKPKTQIDYSTKEITATELKKHTADAIQSALQAPVTILKNGRPLIVIISQEQFEYFMRLQQASIKKPFPFGIGDNHPSINKNSDDEEFLRPMTEAEYEDFLEGKY